MSDSVKLIERLQTGWRPTPGDLGDIHIQQHTFDPGWQWIFRLPEPWIIGHVDEHRKLMGPVMWMDENQSIAVLGDFLIWLG
jgi:hypothetical protein